MTKQVLNNGISGAIFRQILNENFTDLYNNKSDKNHASSTTDFGVASTTFFGHIKVTNGNGLNISNGVLSMNAASTSQAGTVQLVNNATTNDATKAATAAALKGVKDAAINTYTGTSNPGAELGKDGDIYIKTA